jgi:cellobiose-specific phosphotransferase system component IIC
MQTIFLSAVLVFIITILVIRFCTDLMKFKEINTICIGFNSRRYKLINIKFIIIPLIACVITGHNYYYHFDIDKVLLFCSSLLCFLLSVSYVKIISEDF